MKELITIGRAPENTIRIEERWGTVSNLHANIERQGSRLLYYDHSSNGTVINGRKVHNENVEINSGDEILLAGIYKLDWNVILKYLPPKQEPQREESAGGGERRVGRKTVQHNYTEDYDDGRTKNREEGRHTEQFNQNYSREESRTEREAVRAENYGKANTYSQADIDKALEKWNWGASLCTWIWAAFHKVYWPMLILIVAWIPYLGQVCSLCLCVYLGLKGSRMAWKSERYESFESFLRAQRKWTIVGIVLFIVSIFVLAFSVYVTLSLI